MLFAFDIFDWIVIKNNLNGWNYDEKTMILEAYSNESISAISSILEREDWQFLWHRFIWLPWSIWGAVVWNAWCFGIEIENNFLEAEVLDLETWDIKIFSKKELVMLFQGELEKKILF